MRKGQRNRTVESRWAEWSQSLPESLAWHTGVELTAVSVARKGKGWTLRLQVRISKQPKVAWFDSPSYFGCWVQLGAAISHQNIRWFVDRYPPNMGD